MDSDSPHVRVVMRAGGSLVDCRPVFSRDSKFLICAAGCMLQVYSVENDVCCKSMSGHEAAITSVSTNLKNEFQVFSSSLDKTVICWDYIDGVSLHRYNFSFPVWCIFPSTGNQMTHYGVLQTEKDLHNCYLIEFNLREKSLKDTIDYRKLQRGVHSNQNHTAIGCKGSFLAFVKSKTAVFVVDSVQTKMYEFKAKQMIMCIACHPSEYCIATGVKGGQIYLWRNFTVSGIDPLCTELHWHALDVHSLAFSVEGSYLLSGGHECVLAKWMTDSASKTPADTLPRLGSQIINISCSIDNRFYAVCYADNGIQIIGNNFFRGPTIQGLARRYLPSNSDMNKIDKRSTSVGLIYDPRSGALVTNGRPGQLQFFNVEDNRQLFSLNVVGHNYVSPENLNKPMIPTCVEKVAFDSTGNWMATFERRDDGVTAVEARLKFWNYSMEKSSFVLNTSVDTPHNGRLNALKFRPNDMLEDRRSMMFVSSSVDGSIKTWSLINEGSQKDQNLRWSCSGIGVYQSQVAGPIDFSQDGSVLAVAFRDVITLWYPAYCCMCKEIISVPDTVRLDISDVAFGLESSSHLLVFCTTERLVCWNMLSFSLQWCLSLNVTSLIMNPLSNIMAIFTSDKQLLIMSPKSSVPLYKNVNLPGAQVAMACFLPEQKSGSVLWQAAARLYFMNSNQELYSLFAKDEIDDNVKRTAPLQLNFDKRSVLSMLMAPGDLGALSRTVPVSSHVIPATSKFIEEALNNQFIAMPPVSLLCMSFMESLLIRKTVSTEGDSDSDSAVDLEEAKSFDDSDMDIL